MQFSNKTFNRMSAALSVLLTRNFSKMFLRARQALEFSHGLGQQRTFSHQMCTRPHNSFDHLVGENVGQGRDRNAESVSSLAVDYQIEFRGLLDQQIGWLCALENLSTVSLRTS